MTARAWRQIGVVSLVVAICTLAWAAPGLVAAAAGWELTANPTTVAADQAATVELRVTDTEGSGDIACARIFIGAEFEVLDVGVRGTSAPSPWIAERAGAAPTTVSVRNADGNGKLKSGDWVDFYVAVGSNTPGDHAWTVNALQNNDCTGDPFVEPITLAITVDSAAPATPPAPAAPATPPIPAEPIAPPAAAPVAEPSPAPTFAFTSRAGALDAIAPEPTPGATSRPFTEIGEPAHVSVETGGAIREAREREAGEGEAKAGSGTGALITLVAILGGVAIYWVLSWWRGRRAPDR